MIAGVVAAFHPSDISTSMCAEKAKGQAKRLPLSYSAKSAISRTAY